jgi:RHS repeat-associated protein
LAEAFTGSSVALTYGFNKVHQENSRSVTDGAYLWHPSVGGTVSYGTANSINEYPTVGGASYSYDGNGNLQSDGTWTYSYDTENHLLSANKTGVSASYVYDPLHRQIQKTVGSTKSRYVYAGWQRIADYDGTSGSLQNRYVYGTSLDEALIQVSSAGVVTYMHADRNGSIVATTNSSGTVTNSYKFGPFGESAPLTGTTFGFTGQRYDTETGLYYYKRRYYSPSIGRFLQPDPKGYVDGLNLYYYVKNDPLNYIDPYGEELCDCPGMDLTPQTRNQILADFLILAGIAVAGVALAAAFGPLGLFLAGEITAGALASAGVDTLLTVSLAQLLSLLGQAGKNNPCYGFFNLHGPTPA